ncbi:DNA polymerase IV [Rhizorhapis suberifaciens]|uniref:DNA polymerase IV n=1 Tax=Rhizorhapis suberifaciens TaxID=13656 RepID=A0A840HTI7_9SPHN|nr:DNA polymerase IV [Rhizorhapis suberifaciens]MBB4641011.1 DNA polymerase-4 [Rhizorhapis suberifaciens]
MGEATIRKIIHVDMDAFFASVEQRDDPSLRGRAVAVGHAASRGVVAAASYEARRFGVRSAMPSATALRKCPELLFVPPRFDVYREVSRHIRAIFSHYTELVEPLSLDEAYMDITANLRALPSATATAQEVRARIREETGLTASAGISFNKFLAKLGSDQRKPDGQFVITPAQAESFIAKLDIGRFHGVGPRTVSKMHALGIFTGSDLQRHDLAFLQQHFGKSGSWYHAIARGEDDRPVLADRERKSSGSETTFATDLVDPALISEATAAQAGEVWEWCHKAGMYGRTVTVKVKYADFRQITRSRTLAEPVNNRTKLLSVSQDLVRQLFPLRKPIRLLGVTLSNFPGPQAIGGYPEQLAFSLE